MKVNGIAFQKDAHQNSAPIKSSAWLATKSFLKRGFIPYRTVRKEMAGWFSWAWLQGLMVMELLRLFAPPGKQCHIFVAPLPETDEGLQCTVFEV